MIQAGSSLLCLTRAQVAGPGTCWGPKWNVCNMCLMHTHSSSSLALLRRGEGTAVNSPLSEGMLLPGAPSSCPALAGDPATSGLGLATQAQGRGVRGCLLDLNLRDRAQGWAQKKPGQEAWVGESAWASLGSLSKYGRFFFFWSAFESRRPWPKRSAFQILQAGLCQPCRAHPHPVLASSVPSQTS